MSDMAAPEASTEAGGRPSVVLGVAGGIAAYKAAELLRRFTETGHDVTVVPTPSALHFVGEATWAGLSGKPVQTQVWESVHEVPHVRIGQSADLVVVAPATADLLARAAQGRADDLLTNVLLTARCPVVFVPAMHTEMWEHAATQANVATLRQRGALVVEPAVGRLTGADSGKGRLPDPDEIFAICQDVLAHGVARARPGRPDRRRLRGWHPRAARPGALPRQPVAPVGRASPWRGRRGQGCRGDPRRRQRLAARPGRRQGGPGRDHRGAARRRGVGGGVGRRRRDGGRARRLPPPRRHGHQDQEGRRRFRPAPRADPDPRHPCRAVAHPRPPRAGHRRLRRRDRRRDRVGARPRARQARPQGLRPPGRQRRPRGCGLRVRRQPGRDPGRRRQPARRTPGPKAALAHAIWDEVAPRLQD